MSTPVRRTNLFLIELIVNLVVFSVCAAVCVGLLVYARGLSQESTALTSAVYVAQSAAELYKSNPPAEAEILQTFDAQWNVVEGGSPSYLLRVEPTTEGADLTVTHMDGREIYALSICSTEGGTP